MFEAVRNNQRILQIVLLVLILPSFVFFGLSGYDRFLGSDDHVAQVGGRKIFRAELENAVRDQLAQVRQSLGAAFDPKVFDTPEARAKVLDGLIDQRTLDAVAVNEQIFISDESLRKAITTQTGLVKPDGSFDLERYRSLLAAQGRTEASFESELRQSLVRRLVPEALNQSSIVPSAVRRRLLAALSEGRTVETWPIVPADFAKDLQPTEEQLAAYYKENSEKFMKPQSAKVSWVVLSADALGRQATISEDEIKAKYESDGASFGRPERRRASHILIRLDAAASEPAVAAAKAKAQSLNEQLRQASAERFADVARAESDDVGSKGAGGDLDWFTPDSMVKPFADAVFAAKAVGTLAEPVRSEFGFHVIRLVGIEPAAKLPLTQVRGQIEAELRKQLSTKRYAESVEAFTNLAYEQSDSLEPLASRFGLQIKTIDALGSTGPLPDAAGVAPAAALLSDPVLKHPRLLTSLFAEDSVKNRRNTEAIEIAPGLMAAARILEYQPARLPEMSAIKTTVQSAWISAESIRRATASGATQLAALQKGENSSAERFSAPVAVSRMVRTELPAKLAQAVLVAPTAKLPQYVGVDLGATGFVIARISKVVPGDPAQTKDADPQITEQLQRADGEQALSGWLKATQTQLGVVRKLTNTNAKGSSPQ